MEQSNIQKIKQLLKSDDESNHILAIQLMKGQGISVDEIIDNIDENDYTITFGYKGRLGKRVLGLTPGMGVDDTVKYIMETFPTALKHNLSKLYNKL